MEEEKVKELISKIVDNSGVANPLQLVKDSVKGLCKERLNQHIKACNSCIVNSNCKSLGYGNPNASLLIIGNNFDLDSMEKSITKPFSKTDYKYIDIVLNHLKMNYDDIFFMNAVNCPNIRIVEGDYKEIIPNPKQTKSCKAFTDFAIDFIEPRAIILMGSVAVNSYLPSEGTLFELRGKWFNIKGIETMVTYDPKYFEQMRAFGKDIEYVSERQLEFLDDFKSVFSYIKSIDKNTNLSL